jgi:hypothetical protein
MHPPRYYREQAEHARRLASLTAEASPSPQLLAGPVAFVITNSWTRFFRKKTRRRAGFEPQLGEHMLVAITASDFCTKKD